MSESHDLSVMIGADVAIITVSTADEPRVLDLVASTAAKRGAAAHQWTATDGLRALGLALEPTEHDELLTDPEKLLRAIARTKGPAVYALCDFHPYLKDDPIVVRLLKDIAYRYAQLGNTIVMISHDIAPPPEISRLAAAFELALPSDQQLLEMVKSTARDYVKQTPGTKVRTDQATLDKLVANLRGMTHSDAKLLIRHAINRDGAITETDLPELNQLKFKMLDSEGLLRFEHDTAQFEHVAGLDNLKTWLRNRRQSFLVPATDDDVPQGILLLGVQGCGKSLAARAVAGVWNVPLLRLDFGALYNKYFGETERNLRNTLSQAELMAPCVLWIDELEKGVATQGSDNATAKRVLGTLLTWMAERKKPVFIVATANDVTQLPPELVRKGRLDEIFFVDLPTTAERAEILRIHLERRQINLDGIDLNELADACDGFSGAELEQVVVSARQHAQTNDATVDTASLHHAMTSTYPLSVVMREPIAQLRHWAKDRTVPA